MNPTEPNSQIAANVVAVRQRIREAAIRSGRSETDVTLVAVTKYASTTDGIVEALLAAGCRDLGESRPQNLVEKAELFTPCLCSLPPWGRDRVGGIGAREKQHPHPNPLPKGEGTKDSIHWHLIGPLQRNKVRKILPLVSLIHSVDSVRLAEAIDRIAAELSEETGKPIKPSCLLEVAISDDATKCGFDLDELPTVLDRLAVFRSISFCGLMGMAGLDADASTVRRQFAALRCLAESLQLRGTPDNVSLTELSMGMSGDFEMAIEEGATLVRVGSLLYSETE